MVFVIGMLWFGESLFLSKTYPSITATILYFGKPFYIGVVISLLLKNPGLKSQLKTKQLPPSEAE